MRLTKLFLFLLPSIFSQGFAIAQQARNSVLVCYGKLNTSKTRDFRYLIVESNHYSANEVRLLARQNQHVLAYISLGEVNAAAPHYAVLKNSVLGKNELWNSYYLDFSKPKTRETLLQVIESGLNQGYDGFFFDNLDNFGSFGKQTGQQQDVINFLKEVRSKFPDKIFIQNAGLELIDRTATFVDAVLTESVATDYNFSLKQYQLRNKKDFETRLEQLQKLRDAHKLPIILVEYANTKSLRDSVITRIKNTGFDYFIGTIDLQKIPSFK